MIKKPTTSRKKTAAARTVDPQFSTKVDEQKTFIDHVNELKMRAMWVVLSLIVASVVAYIFEDVLMAVIQKPFGQTLYYTSPVGGLNFLIKLCITFGAIVALPIMMYQIARFFAPVLEKTHKNALLPYLFTSVLLAYGGVVFAYLISLPNALQFLTGFSDKDVSALITANEYYDFVLAYLLGFAALFQIPLIVLFVNRIKPLTPGGMMKAQRYIILASFIVAAILTPTPDPVNQTIMALPAVLLYQISIMLVWRINRKRKIISVVTFDDIPEEIIVERAEPIPVVQAPTLQPRLLDGMTRVQSSQLRPIQAQLRTVSDFLVRPQPVRRSAQRQIHVRPTGRFMDVVAT